MVELPLEEFQEALEDPGQLRQQNRWLTTSEPHLQLPSFQTSRGPPKPRFVKSGPSNARSDHYNDNSVPYSLSHPKQRHRVSIATNTLTEIPSSRIPTPRLAPPHLGADSSPADEAQVCSHIRPTLGSPIPQKIQSLSLNAFRACETPAVAMDPLPREKGANQFDRFNWKVDGTVTSTTTGCSTEEFEQKQWENHQNNPSQPLQEVSRCRGLVDQCLAQDERCLNVDEFISAVPVGNYISTDQAFRLLQDPSSYSNANLDTEDGSLLPQSFSDVLRKHNERGVKVLCGSIPSLEAFWYVDDKVVHLWRWGTTKNNHLELCFCDEVVAVGAVDPKPFLLDEDISSPSRIPRLKCLLIATTSQMSLWLLKFLPDPTSSSFDAVPSPFTCPSPASHVTTITGHDESGRLFYGDASGGIYEFVYLPTTTSSESWTSFLLRVSGWKGQASDRQRTISEKVTGPSVISKVLGLWAGGRYPVVSLSFDPHRSLLYAVDGASNIDLFYLPPPEILESGFTEYCLQPIASLSRSQAASQMMNIFRQVIRATQPSQAAINASRQQDSAHQMIATNCNIIRVVPLGRNEGAAVAAVALTADGSRLFLRLRLELPLLPKRLEATHNPDITSFQHVKAIQVLNWKPSPPSASGDGTPRTPRPASQLFFNCRTFLVAFSGDNSSSCLMCVTPDEGDIYKRQTLSADTSALSQTSNPKNLKEWWQSVSLVDTGRDNTELQVMAIYEHPLEPMYKQLLEGRGSLPDPFNTVGRIRAQCRVSQREKDREEPQPLDGVVTTTTSNRQSFGRNSARISISPWDVPLPSDQPRVTHEESSLGLGRVSACHKYVPPSSLHSFSATFTVPGRVFAILTNKGVFLLQQQRFSDLYKDSAQAIISSFTETACRRSCITDIVDTFCSPPSPSEFLDLKSILNPEIRQTTPVNPKLSLLNVFASAELFTAEQVMAVIWQMLTGTYEIFPWPSISHMGKQLPIGSSKSFYDATIATPFNRRDSLEVLGSAITRRSMTPVLSSLFNPPEADALSLSTSHKAFQWTLLIDTLVTIMTNPNIHNDVRFADSGFPAAVSIQGPGTGVPLLTSARTKGLALFLCRILRPFWSTSIFESADLRFEDNDDSLESLIVNCPGVYRRKHTTGESVSSALFGANSVSYRDDEVGRKRKRTETGSPIGSPLDSKRARNSSEDKRKGQVVVPPISGVTILTCRFGIEEFHQTQSWLDRLEHVIADILTRIPTPSSRQPIITNDRGVVLGTEQERLQRELSSLRSLGLFCKIASQTLACCSFLLNVTEGRELPAETFDILVAAPLSDLVCSPIHRGVLKDLLSRQVLPPFILKTSCSWIFGREDLDLQCALQPLKVLHQSIYQYRWKKRMLPFPDCVPVERNSAFRSNEVQQGIRALLASAGSSSHDRSPPEVGPIVILLAELQMFDVLAEFIARLAESMIRQHGGGERTSESGNLCKSLSPSYMSDRLFRHCLDRYFIYIEDLLDHYQVVARRTGETVGREVAVELVKACLSVDIPDPNQCSTNSFKRHRREEGSHISSSFFLESKEDPRSSSRVWLHFVVLDWINECGQRKFPIPLESLSSPVYASWMEVHKEDLGDKASRILSEFLLNNGEYKEFSNFLIGVASKRWPDPQTILEDICIPNFNERSQCDSPPASFDPMSLLSLERHASRVIGSGGGSIDNVRVMSDMWNGTMIRYLNVTQGGTTLAERLKCLIQAKDGLANGMMQMRTKENKRIGTSSFLRSSPPDDRYELANLAAIVDRLICMVELQAALVREAIEVAIFLVVQSSEIGQNAFSFDHGVRKMFMDELKSRQRNQYTRIRNIQALLYILQWKLFDSPAKLFAVLQDLASAVVKDDFPVPGLALLSCPSHYYKICEEDLPILIERIKDAAYCRCHIAVKLSHPEMIDDFVSKYLLIVLGAQHEYKPEDSTVKVPLNEKLTSVKLLMNGISHILYELHAVASEFRIIEQNTQHSVGNINWESKWWIWPSTVIYRQLNIADHFINTNVGAELDEQYQLPILRAVVDSYRDVMFNHRRTLNLEDAHMWIILFDVQESWLQQIFRMTSCLAFIHLLDEGEATSRQLLASDLKGSCEKPLLDMFYRSPSKIQALSDKCSSAIKSCQTAVEQCKEWFLSCSSVVDHYLAHDNENSYRLHNEDAATRISHLTSIRASRQSFLDALECLQRRILVLLQYQRILQRVACSNEASIRGNRRLLS